VNRSTTRLRSFVAHAATALTQNDWWHGERRVSERFVPWQLAGYPLDLRAKTRPFDGPTSELGVPLVDFGGTVGFHVHPVTVCQVALGWHERWLADGERDARRRFLALADWLLDHQQPWHGGAAWPVDVTSRLYGGLTAPWVSALVQGQALSVLARALRLRNGDSSARRRLRQAMDGSFLLFEREVSAGGLLRYDSFGVVYEEYPSREPSIVLNGLLSSLWGLADFAVVQRAGPARRAFDTGAEALVRRLPRYDTGFWSRYCLWAPAPEVASPYYHRAHVAQLAATAQMHPDPRWEETRQRWAHYQTSTACRTLALGCKVAQRIARNVRMGASPLRTDHAHEFESRPTTVSRFDPYAAGPVRGTTTPITPDWNSRRDPPPG